MGGAVPSGDLGPSGETATRRIGDASEKKHFEAASSGIIGFLVGITISNTRRPDNPRCRLAQRGHSVKPVAPSVDTAVQPASENLRDSSQRWWLAALLVVAMIFGYAQRGALSPVAPYMIKELGLSPAVMGILLSAFFWVYSFMQMPAGWLVDRYGVRRSYAIGYAFWSVVSTLTGLANGLATLITARVLLGAGQSVAFPASARAVANWFPDRERGTVTGAYLMGVRLGQALVSIAAGYFLADYGWKLFFFIIGVIPLVWLLPWNLFLKKWEHRGMPTRVGRNKESNVAFLCQKPSSLSQSHGFWHFPGFSSLRLCLVRLSHVATRLSGAGKRFHGKGNGVL